MVWSGQDVRGWSEVHDEIKALIGATDEEPCKMHDD